ncbi:MAG TPA: hypothetical protein VJM33_19855 [Microthrixaceae bacterium]|nr:hypothetical protein [Microthrixaceae bacterium]
MGRDEHDDLIAARVERIVEWNGHLRPSEQAALREAAERLRALEQELHRRHETTGRRRTTA